MSGDVLEEAEAAEVLTAEIDEGSNGGGDLVEKVEAEAVKVIRQTLNNLKQIIVQVQEVMMTLYLQH